ncbi:Hypothetical protein BN2458_PEG0910 [Helicobacter typhlonius]|uniref:Uncharacterized protein n=1 Tax=Helicobacter typhlonius TaxID=76936 RepID=A0A0S4PU13_9HELI|nr:Hypothetical protein BN2458_PEG0910 [Helicobacter typhlonius]
MLFILRSNVKLIRKMCRVLHQKLLEILGLISLFLSIGVWRVLKNRP